MKHALPRRLRRYALPGWAALVQWSPRQRYILEASLARYRSNFGEPPPLLRGELGTLNGVRFVANAGGAA